MARTPDQERFQGDVGALEVVLDDERENHSVIRDGLSHCEKVADLIKSLGNDENTASDLKIIETFKKMAERRKDFAWGRIRSVKSDRNHAMGVPSLEEALAQAKAGKGGPLAAFGNATDMFSAAADSSGASGPMPSMGSSKTKKKNKKKKKKPAKFQVKVNGTDEIGDYCLVTTTKRGTVKYYTKLPSLTKKIHEKRAFPQEFPAWCTLFSDFCSESKLDNIILDREITDDEQEALRAGMELTMKKMFDIRVDFSLKANDLFAELKRKARSYYTPELKAKRWHELMIDRSCCDTISLEAKLKEMIMMERCSAPKTLQYHYINSLIKSAINFELWNEYMATKSKDRTLDSIPPEHLVTDLIMLLGKRNEMENRSPRDAVKCTACESLFHSFLQCPIGL